MGGLDAILEVGMSGVLPGARFIQVPSPLRVPPGRGLRSSLSQYVHVAV